ncbi:hypothetical protein E1B28_006638 [Marasmius oreades]|uniref:INO80 complex subunit B-like conserved region domain-containing protein n=1 Tax=Marasmius oreades TaxID=181124 RepID=A0A9P8AA99_9AGAR|nr:uncharacterized protein E1B28_006638 [Marasmius oreades]KAG7095954.1 hypothetical protein E1B28_006638 [Marasmius oreades]
MEKDQHNYARTHPARATSHARNSRYLAPVPHTTSPADYNSMQLRKRTNQPSMREISDEDEGEEEVEEEEDEDEEVDGEEEVYDEAEADVDVEDDDAEVHVDADVDDAEVHVDADVDDAEEEEEHRMEAEVDDDDDASLQQPRLKIKLKLPAVPSSTSNSATPVPEETRIRTTASSKRSAAVRSRRRIQDIDSSEEDVDKAGPSRSTRPMTTRQAVLANVVDPSHVSLDPNIALPSDHKPNPRKKQLNESELALRREETARKRKNLSEKKLEDEKFETINRLLRKQSKPRAKKGAGSVSGGVTPVNRGGKRVGGGTRGGKTSRGGRSGLATAKASTVGSEVGDEEGANVENEGEANDEEGGVEGEDEEAEEVDHASGSWNGHLEEVHQIPMFRWISTSRPVETQKGEASPQQWSAMDVDIPVTSAANVLRAMEVDTKPPSKAAEFSMPVATTVTDVTPVSNVPPSTTKSEDAQQLNSGLKRMTLSFSIPASFLSESPLAQTPTSMPPPSGPQICAVAECSSPRKYRLVSDWTIGACGMGHLKILESQARLKAGVA